MKTQNKNIFKLHSCNIHFINNKKIIKYKIKNNPE